MSANYDIVLALSIAPRPIEYMRYNFPSFRKRMYDLKKMWFKFENVIDTHTWVLHVDMVNVPLSLEIDNEKETIKVGDYWRDYRNKLETERNEEEQMLDFFSNATLSQLLWYEFKESVKQFISKLFK